MIKILSGKDIKIVRVIYGITATEISDETNLSLTKVSRIEKGYSGFSKNDLLKIEKALCKIIREKTEGF